MKSKYENEIDRNCPLSEYPRPQMERDSYLCLNGQWQYAVIKNRKFDIEEDPGTVWAGIGNRHKGASYGTIRVPFSPESELSGANFTLRPDETLWYRREFEIRELMEALPEEIRENARCILHFGAVDQIADVWVNGVHVGRHIGGFTAFSMDITDALQCKKSTDETEEDREHGPVFGTQELIVRVQDLSDTSDHSRGKQKRRHGGIWYTPQSGIWQTVWLEAVPAVHVEQLRIRPLFDDGRLAVTVRTNLPAQVQIHAQVEGYTLTAEGIGGETLLLMLPDSFRAWSPEDPVLYDLTVCAKDPAAGSLDVVRSYFGMRKFSIEADEKGVKRLYLNGYPYFRTGVLDQGYYSDGLLTPPCDKAMEEDILLMKKLGYNVLRKHIKIEPMRWYYHCDRLGMLVWQDMINGGASYNPAVITLPVFLENLRLSDQRYALFGRKNAAGRKQYAVELKEMLLQLRNVVSLELWTPFNEGWGQFDAEKISRMIRKADPERLIDHASGWYDQGIGETKSLHVYFRPFKYRKEDNRAVILTEFGGYSHRVEEHSMCKKSFGYRGYSTPEKLQEGIVKLYEEQILPAARDGLAAAIYTQLSDVEEEVNGFVTYDREVVKIDAEAIRRCNEKLIEEGR